MASTVVVEYTFSDCNGIGKSEGEESAVVLTHSLSPPPILSLDPPSAGLILPPATLRVSRQTFFPLLVHRATIHSFHLLSVRTVHTLPPFPRTAR